MAVTNYYTANGRILGEKVGTGSRTDHLTDALGSVTATLSQTPAVVNTYRYKPYGGQLAKTGTGTDPAFTWVGDQGYRQASNKYADVYVRARHYGTVQATWTTVDPLWPDELPYAYVGGSPSNRVDPTGLLQGCPIEICYPTAAEADIAELTILATDPIADVIVIGTCLIIWAAAGDMQCGSPIDLEPGCHVGPIKPLTRQDYYRIARQRVEPAPGISFTRPRRPRKGCLCTCTCKSFGP